MSRKRKRLRTIREFERGRYVLLAAALIGVLLLSAGVVLMVTKGCGNWSLGLSLLGGLGLVTGMLGGRRLP